LLQSNVLVLRDDSRPDWSMVIPIPHAADAPEFRRPVFVRLNPASESAIEYWRERLRHLPHPHG
jgi:hypothetical protein